MHYKYGSQNFLVLESDLIDFAWSAPMRDLAERVGLSDVGLKKLLRSNGIASPPQGYWNKVRAGKPVPDPPKPKDRKPGETGRIWLDERFSGHVPKAMPIPAIGPFASKYVPEDLGELWDREIAAIGAVRVPKTMTRMHRCIRTLVSKDEARKEKASRSSWHWDNTLYDNPFEKRRLRILNAMLLALAKRGHEGDVYERDRELNASVRIGGTYLGLELDTAKAKRYNRGIDRTKLPVSTPLTLRINPSYDGRADKLWSDDKAGTIESKLTDILADVVVLGESKFRQNLKEEEERSAAAKAAEEKRLQDRLEALNVARLESLHRSGELLRKAKDIRALVAEVRAAIEHSPDIPEGDLKDWEQWALGEANRIDPVLSRQFMEHLKPPQLDDR